MVLQRDRSRELHQFFDSLRSVQAASGKEPSSSSAVLSAASSSSSASVHPDVRVFNEFAQAFAREIASTSENIMNLAKLAQRQSVFDEETQEISALTTVVKTQLQRLHNDMETLAGLKEHAMKSQSSGTFFAMPASAHQEAERHTATVVDTLKSRLARTGQQFKTVLQNRKDTLKGSALRRNQFSSERTTSFESALFRDQQHHEQQHMLMTQSNVQYYRQRADAVREIETAVTEVGELFHDFARLVHEQDELVVRIDSNVDDALSNVNAGSNELMRYLASLSSNRGLILKIFAVLFVFLIFFGFVVVR